MKTVAFILTLRDKRTPKLSDFITEDGEIDVALDTSELEIFRAVRKHVMKIHAISADHIQYVSVIFYKVF